MSTTKQKGNVLAIIVMILLFGMISFVTNLASPMGDILKNQFPIPEWMGKLGVLMNFIAYAFMGIPAGNMLKKRGYKKTSLIAVIVGFVGVGIQTISGMLSVEGMPLLPFGVYLVGAFVAGFSMCMLNIVVNPMLNKLGGGGNRGNRLIQVGGSFNSLMGTAVIFLTGILIPDGIKNAVIGDVFPLMYTALAIFAVAFIVILLTNIPENDYKPEVKGEKSKYGPMSFRHFVLGAACIFIYVGVEVGIPNNLYSWLLEDGVLPVTEKVVADAECDKAECCEQKAECDKAICDKENCDKAECTGDCQKPEGKECCGKENCENCEKKQALVPPTQDGDVPPTPAEETVAPTEEAVPVEEATDVIAEADGAPVEAPATEKPKAEEGMTVEEIAGSVTATYWLLMLVGRLLGAALGARFSARKMLSFVSVVGICLVAGAIFLPQTIVTMPVFMKSMPFFGTAQVPINAVLLVLCGLCTSVMWGGIFNLAVEGLGKYTEKASGIFMALVCGGGIIPFIQGYIATDIAGDYLVSYWLIAAGLAYMLFYALIGSKNVNKDIPTE
ncbi:MAG: hypothetical protein Q4F45_05840 [Alistipes sp.]|nr:hypothetical protein [Alistipes sp.]